MIRTFTIAAAAAAATLMLGCGSAQAKAARCAIGNDYGERYAGPCDFQAEKGGSFTISRKDGKPIVAQIVSVSVTIGDPGQAQVSGITTNGGNSRWGEAVRDPKDKACWKGADFRVCAY